MDESLVPAREGSAGGVILALVATVLLLVACVTPCVEPSRPGGETGASRQSGTPASEPTVSCGASPWDRIVLACNSLSEPLEATCSTPIVPGTTTLDGALRALRSCSLVDATGVKEESLDDWQPSGRVRIYWQCRDWRSSKDTIISSGEPNRVVAEDGVVQWLLWRYDTTAACSPTASAVVDRYGVPEKVLWAIAGYTTEIKWGEMALLYPSRGVVFEVNTTRHYRSVQREDRVVAAYGFVPTPLSTLVELPVQYDWQTWPNEHEGGLERLSWTEKLEDWPDVSP
jgi:hypothetical protein